MPELTKRQRAKAEGKATYTGRMCEECFSRKRYVSNRHCSMCARSTQSNRTDERRAYERAHKAATRAKHKADHVAENIADPVTASPMETVLNALFDGTPMSTDS